MQNAEVRAERSQASPDNAVASPVDDVGMHRTPNEACTLSIAQKNALARRSDKSAVGSPHHRSKVSYNTIGASWARIRLVVQTLLSSMHLHGDCTAFLEMSLRLQHAVSTVRKL